MTNFLERIYSFRLILSRYEEKDMNFILNCSNSPEAAGDFMSQEKLSPEKLRERLANDFYWNQKAKAYTVACKDGELIGLIRFWEKATDNTTVLLSVQICLPEKRGQGYGTEAQVVLVKRLFDCCPYNQVEMYTDLKNKAQQRCLDKLGFQFVDLDVYSDFGEKRNGKLYRLTRPEFERLSSYIY